MRNYRIDRIKRANSIIYKADIGKDIIYSSNIALLHKELKNYKDMISKQDLIDIINHKLKSIDVYDIIEKVLPHEYTLTDEHQSHINEYSKGVTNNDTIKLASVTCKCGFTGCNVPFDEHKMQTAAMIKFRDDGKSKDFKKDLITICKIAQDENKITIDAILFDEASVKLK